MSSRLHKGSELVRRGDSKEDMQQFVGEYVKSLDLSKYEKGVYLSEINTILVR